MVLVINTHTISSFSSSKCQRDFPPAHFQIGRVESEHAFGEAQTRTVQAKLRLLKAPNA